MGLQIAIVATKADEVSKSQRGLVIARLQRDFSLLHPPLAVSSREKIGIDDLLHHLRRLSRLAPREASSDWP